MTFLTLSSCVAFLTVLVLSHESCRESTCIACFSKCAKPPTSKVQKLVSHDLQPICTTPEVKRSRKRSASVELQYPHTRAVGRRKLAQAQETTSTSRPPTTPKSSAPALGKSKVVSSPTDFMRTQSQSRLRAKTRCTALEATRSASVEPSISNRSIEPQFLTPKRGTPRTRRGGRPRLSRKRKARSAARVYSLKERPDLCMLLKEHLELKTSMNILDKRFPGLLCYRCYQRLMAAKRGQSPLKVHPQLTEIITNQPRLSPRHEHFCGSSCRTCVAGNFSGLESVSKSPLASAPPTPSKSSVLISLTKKKLCPQCFQEVGRGLSHKCTRRAALSNLNNRLDQTTKEQIASTVVREKSAPGDEVNTALTLQSKSTWWLHFCF